MDCLPITYLCRMSRPKRKSLPIIENVEILDAAAEGKSIARVNDVVLFVTQAVPGDVADIQLTRKKSSFMEGFPVAIHKKSDKRVEPFCPYFGVCGGCKWQNMGYEHQLFYKQKQVVDNLVRIGHLELPEMESILAAPKTTFYRNKMEYTFSDRKWLTSLDMDSEGQDLRCPWVSIFPVCYDKIIDINICFYNRILPTKSAIM